MKNLGPLAFLSLYFFCTFFYTRTAFSQEDLPPAQKMPGEALTGSNKIQGLKWLTDTLLVERVTHAEEEYLIATLEGFYQHNEWSLIVDKEGVPSDQNFIFKARLAGEVTFVEFTAVGPLGEVERETIKILYPYWTHWKMLSQLPALSSSIVSIPIPNPPIFTAGVGATFLSMAQTLKPTFSLQGLTLKTAYKKRGVNSAFDWSASGFLTVLAFHKSPSDRSATFGGANLRFGYLIPQSNPLWSLSLSLGGYVTTTWVNPNTFGYSNVYGPQIFPTLKRKLQNGLTVGGYLKFSPVTNGLSVLSLSSRELAVGVDLEGATLRKIPFSYSLDIAHLALNIGNSKIQSTSTTVGINFFL